MAAKSPIASQALRILRQKFGHTSFRACQMDVIEKTLQGRDSFVLMATGTGKSLCYQIPAIISPKLTIVVSPLISLMADQVRSLQNRGIPACFLGASNFDRPAELSTLTDKTKILYMTPEKLTNWQSGLEHLDSTRGIGLIAIDEAHCISEWGHDFRHDYRNLSVIRDILPHVPIMALTATATLQAQADITANLRLRKDAVFVKGGFNRPNLTYTIRKKTTMQKDMEELFLSRKASSGVTIVYCTSRKETENIADFLRRNNVDARHYHAGLDADERHAIHEDFHAGRITTLVATSAFGMGIDKPDIRRVIHFGPPTSIEAYQQQTGRAGRDDKPAECICLWSHGDLYRMEALSGLHDLFDGTGEAITAETFEIKRKLVGRMYKMITDHECRRKQLLEYFGEDTSSVTCGKCDVCQSAGRQLYDAGQQAYLVLKTIKDTGSRYGKGIVRAILIGKPKEEFKDKIARICGERFERAPAVYGIGANVPQTWWNPFMEYLLNKEMIIKEGQLYPIFRLSPKGEEFFTAYGKVPGAWDAIKNNQPSPPGTPPFYYTEEPVIKIKKMKKASRSKATSPTQMDTLKYILPGMPSIKMPVAKAKEARPKMQPAVYWDGSHLRAYEAR